MARLLPKMGRKAVPEGSANQALGADRIGGILKSLLIIRRCRQQRRASVEIGPGVLGPRVSSALRRQRAAPGQLVAVQAQLRSWPDQIAITDPKVGTRGGDHGQNNDGF